MDPAKERFANLVSEAHGALKKSRELKSARSFQDACSAAARLLTNPLFPTEFHWFCDNTWTAYGQAALVMLSIPSTAADALYERISEQISVCKDCASIYHSQKQDLCTMLTQEIGLSQDRISLFMAEVTKRDMLRLDERIRDISELDVYDSLTKEDAELLIFELLNVPELAPEQFNLEKPGGLFDQLMQKIASKWPHDVLIKDPRIYPGIIKYLFSPIPDLHIWAKNRLLGSDIDVALNQSALKSIESVLTYLSKLSDIQDMKLAFLNLTCLFSSQTSATIKQILQNPTRPSLFEIIEKKLTENKNQQLLAVIMAVLNVLGEKLDAEDLSALLRPSLAYAYMDNVANCYVENICSETGKDVLTDADRSYDPSFHVDCRDAFEWMSKIDKEHGDSKTYLTNAMNFTLKFLEIYSKFSKDIEPKKKKMILIHMFSFMSNSLQLKNHEDANSYCKRNDYLIRLDMIDIAKKNKMLIIENCKEQFASLFDAASPVLEASIRLDISICLDKLYGENAPMLESQHNESLWSAFNRSAEKYLGTKTATVLLRSMRHGTFVSKIGDTSSTATDVVKNIENSLKILNDMNEKNLLETLENFDALVSLFGLSFSANKNISQSAVDIMTLAFDPTAANRSECFKAMLKKQPKTTLAALGEAVSAVADMKIFSPSVGVLKVVQDMLEALYEPRSGVMGDALSSNLSADSDSNELLRYWISNWHFLTFTMQNSKLWATSNDQTLMLDFIRDELDYCHDLLDKFRLFESDLQTHKIENTGEIVARPAIVSVEALCGLLRLRDEKLINTSCDNIKSIITLMKSFNVSIPPTLVNLFIDYAKRDIKSNMPENMTRTLLKLTGQLSSEQIERLIDTGRKNIEKTENTQRTTTLQPLVRKKTQKTLLDYANLMTLPAPKPVEKEAPRLSEMDLIRQGLFEKRFSSGSTISSSKATDKSASMKVHPARPSGFNDRRKSGSTVSVAIPKTVPRVNARDESSSSDDDSDDGIFAIAGRKRKSHKNNPSATVQNVLVAGSRLSASQIAERDMKARMSIDLNPLYKQILSWDFHHMGEYPVADNKVKKTYKAVPQSFTSWKEYQEIFEPLLLLECWQSIRGSKNDMFETAFKLDLGKRVRFDEFYDVFASTSRATVAKQKLTDNDIVVLTCYGSQQVHLGYPNSSLPYCLAKITKISKSSSAAEFSDIVLRVFDPPTRVLHQLAQGYSAIAHRVINLVTIEREYCALKGLFYYEQKNFVLDGEPNFQENFTESEEWRTQKQLGTTIAQTKAILRSLNKLGFQLILGPPGTGKTKTILGIIKKIMDFWQMKYVARSKILVCAPSNAAVDELVLRLKNGIPVANGAPARPSIIRLGRSDAVNSQVRDVTLEEIVDRELNKKGGANDAEEQEKLRKEQADCARKLDEFRRTREKRAGVMSQEEADILDDDIRQCIKRVKELRHQSDIKREEMIKEARNREFSRKQIQDQKLREADVVCATLSGSAHNVLISLQIPFDTVIIDEAAQSIELSCLIPLKYGCTSCIMVGDPNQLPPTVLSQAAASLNYEQSLFVRMYKNNPTKVSLLDTQFRMHPDIAFFPSMEFYGGKLKTHPSVLLATERPWHACPDLAPYRFFDVIGREETDARAKSLYNMAEIAIVLELFTTVTNFFPTSRDKGKVGIISPYKQQVLRIKEAISREFGNSMLDYVDISTVDGFQGQEKEIIIFSCVRADDDKSIGFLKDRRRLNVAITRAQSSLWIVGHSNNLRRSPIWRHLIEDAREREMFARAHAGFLKNKTQEILKIQENIRRNPKPVSKVLCDSKALAVRQLEYEAAIPVEAIDIFPKNQKIEDPSQPNPHFLKSMRGEFGVECLESTEEISQSPESISQPIEAVSPVESVSAQAEHSQSTADPPRKAIVKKPKKSPTLFNPRFARGAKTKHQYPH